MRRDCAPARRGQRWQSTASRLWDPLVALREPSQDLGASFHHKHRDPRRVAVATAKDGFEVDALCRSAQQLMERRDGVGTL